MTLTDRLNGINLYLIGMMGAGKSSTGAALAQTLGYQFFDTDAVVVEAAGQSIPDLFASQGETAFRQLETEVLAELSAYRRLVIATGGGIVTQQKNWSYLHHGIVVWLDVPTAVLQGRLAGETGRPLLQGQDWETQLTTLLAQRQHLYAQADVQVTVGAGEAVEAIAARILDLVAERIRSEANSGTDSAVLN
ncbi:MULTISPECIES: shikimate kinase [Cyanophyceae]|uniref:Shikimate kinase n=1 Tax=Leptolyngbya subtilissima DQ-A4 TaxID=2933933 RepID=A0ABV0K2M1_9CYAN|nr:shikimate kinase [Nodosilinea sp. FACHB-141]MBD2112997.1 shikimate kinase [Nodosilinea sp. FACHB-141]